jgi:hypothetical protein
MFHMIAPAEAVVLIVFLNRVDGEIVTAGRPRFAGIRLPNRASPLCKQYANAAFLGEHTVLFRRLCVPLGWSDRSKTTRHGQSGDSKSARLVPWILAAAITRAKDISRKANRRRAASPQAESRRTHPFAETRNQYWPAWANIARVSVSVNIRMDNPRTFSSIDHFENPSLEVLFVV